MLERTCLRDFSFIIIFFHNYLDDQICLNVLFYFVLSAVMLMTNAVMLMTNNMTTFFFFFPHA